MKNIQQLQLETARRESIQDTLPVLVPGKTLTTVRLEAGTPPYRRRGETFHVEGVGEMAWVYENLGAGYLWVPWRFPDSAPANLAVEVSCFDAPKAAKQKVCDLIAQIVEQAPGNEVFFITYDWAITVIPAPDPRRPSKWESQYNAFSMGMFALSRSCPRSRP